jgi:hypothetical protein
MQISVPDNLPQSSNTNTYEPVPAGKYETTIFDVQAETVKSGQNAGKPRWKVQLKIAEGEFENRRLFVLIPLYVAGDFWKTQSFFESLGYPVKGNFDVPEASELLGKPVVARVVIREAQGEYPADNNVSGFEKGTAKSGADLLASMGATPTDSAWA